MSSKHYRCKNCQKVFLQPSKVENLTSKQKWCSLSCSLKGVKGQKKPVKTKKVEPNESVRD